MIRFDLVCAREHGFEGWFRNGQTYDDQASAGALACPFCGDTTVRKAVMAPAISRRRERPALPAPVAASEAGPSQAGMPAAQAVPPLPTTDQQAPAPVEPRRAAFIETVRMLRQMRDYVEKNFHDVGTGFAEEARKMHYGEVVHRDIYGQATEEEASSLRDEGIAVRQLPLLPKLDG